ncbi:MAG: hypothetical protein R3C49_19755 [Planctomycetaceae bacterium]
MSTVCWRVIRNGFPERLGLRLLDLPEHFGRSLVPYSERFRERFLATLVDDSELRTALRTLLMEGGD